MKLIGLWKLLHLVFAFSYVGSLVVAEWNSRAARATSDWTQRALLFDIVHRSNRTAGLGSLVLLGILGNLVSVQAGYRMATDAWVRWVNGLWLLAVLGMVLINLPSTGRLAAAARSATGGHPSEGYEQAMARWRLGSIVQSALYLGLLVLMVFRWRS